MPLGPFNMFYGFGASPILEDGLLILPVDQDTDPYLLAVDAKTGKQRWRVARPHVISGYSTPTIWRPKTGGRRRSSFRNRSSSRRIRSPTARSCGGCAASRAR